MKKTTAEPTAMATATQTMTLMVTANAMATMITTVWAMEWVCGRIDSDGNDLSAAVGEDTGGVADTGAINAKDKKTLLTKCSHQQLFFHAVFYITF